MKTEIEGKFRIKSIEAIREKLQEQQAICEKPMRLMRRALIEEAHHAAENSFIRIRDEGDKITLSYKRRDEETLHGTKEIEVEVSDFDATIELLAAAGWEYITFQESKRETWKLDEAEVVIDEWPWLDPYIEIEAESEEIVRHVADKLGVDWGTANFGSVDNFYRENFPEMSNRGIIDLKEVRFNDPIPAEFRGER
jgi:adenylate cyclase, class 2